jgi:BolA protein
VNDVDVDRRDHGRYANLMSMQGIIVNKLTAAFSPSSLRVEDESQKHVGHAGYREGGETHYRVYIVTDAFKGKSRIERHRMVNQSLEAELAGSIHALAIHAFAPGEQPADA